MQNTMKDTQIVEIYAIWNIGDNNKKVVEVREKYIPWEIEEDEIGCFAMEKSDFVDEVSAIIDWRVFDKPFNERILDAVNKSELNEDMRSSVLNSIIHIEGYLWKFEYNERLEFIFHNIKSFQKTHNAGISKALDQVSKIFDEVESRYKTKKLSE